MPLDDESRRRGQVRSLEVRRAKAVLRDQREAAIRRVVSETGDLAPAALEAVLDLVVQVRDGLERFVVDSPLDAMRMANAAETLYRIARLASGQSTSNVAHGKALSDEERAERLAYLRSRLASVNDPNQEASDAV